MYTSHHFNQVVSLVAYLAFEIILSFLYEFSDRLVFPLPLLIHHGAKVVICVLSKGLECIFLVFVEGVAHLLLHQWVALEQMVDFLLAEGDPYHA